MDITINTEASIDMIAEELSLAWKQSEGVYDLKIKCAMLLLKLREACEADRDFSLALIDHDITIGKDERAAMLKFAKLPEDQRQFIERDMRRKANISFRRTMEQMEVSHMCETDNTSTQSTETPVSTVVCDESTSQKVSNPEAQVKKVPKNSSIHGRERAEEVAYVVADWGKRNAPGNVHPKSGWSMLLEAMDLGLFSKTGCSVNDDATGRLLFNLPTTKAAVEYLGRYNLNKPQGCKKAEEDLMPFLRRNAEALKVDPSSLMTLKNAEVAAKQREEVARLEAERNERKMVEMASRGEKEVVVAGIAVWPPKHDNIRNYTYEQLRQAWFIFLDAEGIAQANLTLKDGRKSRAICHRHMANKIGRTAENMNDQDKDHLSFVMEAYRAIVLAMEHGPDDKLQTSIPWHDIRISS